MLFLITYFGVGVGLSPLGRSATIWPLYQLRIMHDEECGAVGEMNISR
jgi:hypothetical protein